MTEDAEKSNTDQAERAPSKAQKQKKKVPTQPEIETPPGTASNRNNKRRGLCASISNNEWPGPLDFIRKWCFFACEHPICALLLAVLSIFFVFILWPVIERWRGPVVDAICDTTSLCPNDEPIKKYKLSISTDSLCWRGYISFKLRNELQSAQWGAGTDRMVICANGSVTAEPAEFLAAFADRFPRCLIKVKSGETTAVTLNLNSKMVCRAPYKAYDNQFKPATYIDGINVCTPEESAVAHDKGERFIVGGDEESGVYACNASVIGKYGF